MPRADMEVESLLKLVLALVVLWILVEVAIAALEFVFGLIVGPLSSLIGLVIVVLIVLWLFDHL